MKVKCDELLRARAIARTASLAMLFEVNSEKPGNVTPSKAFKDMNFDNFVYNSIAISDELSKLSDFPNVRVGKTILGCVNAMVRRSGKGPNTHLGTILLLAPLSAAFSNAYGVMLERSKNSHGPAHVPPTMLRMHLKEVLNSLDHEDSVNIFHAVNKANASGLTDVKRLDVRNSETLREIMNEKIAPKAWFNEGFDDNGVCHEYLTDYSLSFEAGYKALRDGLSKGLSLPNATVASYIEILAAFPDNLIMGKHGRKLALRTMKRASEILSLGSIYTKKGKAELKKFDAELRSSRANPGTAADIVSATLFIAFASGLEV